MPTIVFNKPYGVLSQFTDEDTGHPTLKQYIPIPDIYAAGRLDRESEGLLLLTDDGGLIRRISDPAHHFEKTYWAMVEGVPSPDRLEQLETGIQIRGYRTRPAMIRLMEDPGLPPRQKPVTPHGPTTWLEIKIHEGKKHQIRHMTAAVGLFTLRLIRVAIGPVKLDDLPAGAWRELEKSEILALRKWRGYNPAERKNA